MIIDDILKFNDSLAKFNSIKDEIKKNVIELNEYYNGLLTYFNTFRENAFKRSRCEMSGKYLIGYALMRDAYSYDRISFEEIVNILNSDEDKEQIIEILKRRIKEEFKDCLDLFLKNIGSFVTIADDSLKFVKKFNKKIKLINSSNYIITLDSFNLKCEYDYISRCYSLKIALNAGESSRDSGLDLDLSDLEFTLLVFELIKSNNKKSNNNLSLSVENLIVVEQIYNELLDYMIELNKEIIDYLQKMKECYNIMVKIASPVRVFNEI